jgi:hypothetical protein
MGNGKTVQKVYKSFLRFILSTYLASIKIIHIRIENPPFGFVNIGIISVKNDNLLWIIDC